MFIQPCGVEPSCFVRQTGQMVEAHARSRLLVASPPLDDPNFDRSVVYIIDHSNEGAIGVIINRPLFLPEIDPMERWHDHLTEPVVIFDGGPVDPSALIALALGTPTTPESIEGAVRIADAVWSVDLSLDPSFIAPYFGGLRIFRGYAGWSAGQLDAEIDAGGWIVVNAETNDLFGSKPETLWRQVLSRQPGRLSWLADAPDDIEAN